MSEQEWSTTVSGALRDAAAIRGDRGGFTFADPRTTDKHYSWNALLDAARARLAALYAEGLRKGDRLAMVIPVPEDFVLNFLAATLGGIIPVPMYPPVALGKVESYVKNVEHIVTSSGAKALLISKQVRPILGSVLDTGSVTKLLLVESLNLDAPRAGTEPSISPEDVCFLQYTSGSTASPKGVVVTHANLAANCRAIASDGLRLDPDRDHGVSWLPLYHDMGLIGFVIVPLFGYIPITFLPTMEFVKRPSYWLEMMHKQRATVTFAPNFAYALATRRAKDSEIEKWDLSCLKQLGCGAEPIQPATLRDFVARFSKAGIKGTALLPCYGMAENTLAISFARHATNELRVDTVDVEAFRQGEARFSDPATAAPGSTVEVVCCGEPFPGHEVSVRDPDGNVLPERVIGELCMKGPSVCPGYYNNPETTAASFKDGWLYSGDKGYIADGAVYVCGRIKDMIIVHGRNYYPTDIEWVVNDVEGVRRGSTVAFACLPASASSEQLVLVAEWAGRERPSEEALEAIKKRVTEVVVGTIGLNPWQVVLIPPGTVPKTSSGKLQRRKTKQQFEEGTLGQEAPTTESMDAKVAVAKQMARSYVSLAKSEVVSRLPDPVRAFFGKKK
ncbi:MAG: fatty acyl-AMP ligase [Myxococcaceae bacterium]|nr:MAG: fatty acyl-AMP ligase [Myxococcaceae bacterium]